MSPTLNKSCALFNLYQVKKQNLLNRGSYLLNESAAVAQEGAKAAKVARMQIEKSTGKSAVSKLNAKNLGQRQITEKKTRKIKK